MEHDRCFVVVLPQSGQLPLESRVSITPAVWSTAAGTPGYYGTAVRPVASPLAFSILPERTRASFLLLRHFSFSGTALTHGALAGA